MPGFNRQGPPFGDGNQSGRRMGKCNPKSRRPEDSNEELELESEKLTRTFGKRNGLGRRNDQGFGLGLGRRNRFRNQNFFSEE